MQTRQFKTATLGLAIGGALILAGILGWVYYQQASNSQQAANTSTKNTNIKQDKREGSDALRDGEQKAANTMKEKPQQFSVVKKDDTFSVYTNTSRGFAFDFPTQLQTEAGCKEITTVTDRNGSVVHLKHPIQSSYQDLVNLQIVSSEDVYTIAPPKSVMAGKESYVTPGGVGYPTTCKAENITPEYLKTFPYRDDYYIYPVHTSWIVYTDVNQGDILKKTQGIVSNPSTIAKYSIGDLIEGRQSLDFHAGREAVSRQYGNIKGGWYYPDKKILAILASWRSGDFMYTKRVPNYEITTPEMLNSFRLL